MFNLPSFFFTMSVSDSVANNLIASVSKHLLWFVGIFLLEGWVFFFPEETFVGERIS